MPFKYRATYLHNGVQHVAITLAESESSATVQIAQNALIRHGDGIVDIVSCDITTRDNMPIRDGDVYVYY